MSSAVAETLHNWCNSYSSQQPVHPLWASWPLLPGRCLHPLLQQNTFCLGPPSTHVVVWAELSIRRYTAFLYKAHLLRSVSRGWLCTSYSDRSWYENVCTSITYFQCFLMIHFHATCLYHIWCLCMLLCADVPEWFLPGLQLPLSLLKAAQGHPMVCNHQ